MQWLSELACQAIPWGVFSVEGLSRTATPVRWELASFLTSTLTFGSFWFSITGDTCLSWSQPFVSTSGFWPRPSYTGMETSWVATRGSCGKGQQLGGQGHSSLQGHAQATSGHFPQVPSNSTEPCCQKSANVQLTIYSWGGGGGFKAKMVRNWHILWKIQDLFNRDRWKTNHEFRYLF